MLETPGQLVAKFERGEIDRAEFQSLMLVHQRELIEEIDEDHQNPLAAWLESRLAKSSLKKLLKKHSTFQIREILIALSEAEGFPLAKYIWNATHPDIPLHCFFRMRREPIFQILSIRSHSDSVELHLEIHKSRNRQKIILKRDSQWRLSAPSFSKDVGQV
ncbi:MAG: hypothetical protein AB8D78_15780 [Akkermansiaceae bacterium]